MSAPGASTTDDAAAVASLMEGVPPLPPDATPEEKDLHWYKHVYQGDDMPQFTFRSVMMGAILGMAMSVSNLYTTMKVGWGFGVAVTACVMSFVFWNGFRKLSGGRLTQMSILENNCMQSTASAAGASTGATIATCFGALLILTGHHEPWWAVGAFTLATAAMGVFLAIPMKRQMINQEQLPFPSGIAAATTLKSLYSEGAEAMRRAYSLVIAMFLSAIVGILNTGEDDFVGLGRFFEWMRKHLFNVHLPEQVPEDGLMQINGKPLVGAGFEPSVMLIAAGMIVGLRVSLSMLLASGLVYFVFAPYLAAMDQAQYGLAGYVTSLPMNDSGSIFTPTRWSLWGGTAIMVFSSLTALALQWKTVARSFARVEDPQGTEAHKSPEGRDEQQIRDRMAAIEVPNSWLVYGMVPITLALLAVQLLAFHIGILPGLLAVAMTFVLSMVACRATGETDTTPIGAMGKVMQLIFALISPGNVTHNLVSAGVAANSASSSADLLTDLKSGYLLGANPRKQFLAQFVGVFFGTLAIVPAWYLMIPNKDALDKYPLPATQTWVAVAQVLSKGFESLPHSALVAAAIGAVIGILLPVIESIFPKARPYLPSAMGLGLGCVVFFSNALAFTIGAVIAWAWEKASPKTAESYNVPIASGLVAGESLMKALLAMLATGLGLVSPHVFGEIKANLKADGRALTAYIDVDRGDTALEGKKLLVVKEANGETIYRASLGTDPMEAGAPGLVVKERAAGQPPQLVYQPKALEVGKPATPEASPEHAFVWDAGARTFLETPQPRYLKRSYALSGALDPKTGKPGKDKIYVLTEPCDPARLTWPDAPWTGSQRKTLVIETPGAEKPFEVSLGTQGFDKGGAGFVGPLLWTNPQDGSQRLRVVFATHPWNERDFAWDATTKSFKEVAPPHPTPPGAAAESAPRP